MNQVEFLGPAHTLIVYSSNVQNCSRQTGSKKTDTQVEIFFVSEVLSNSYQSHNLIGPYHFWGITPQNPTSPK